MQIIFRLILKYVLSFDMNWIDNKFKLCVLSISVSSFFPYNIVLKLILFIYDSLIFLIEILSRKIYPLIFFSLQQKWFTKNDRMSHTLIQQQSQDLCSSCTFLTAAKGFIDWSLTRSTHNPTTTKAWNRVDSMVMGWIISVLDDYIVKSILSYKSAR